jgi:hypothetical protein
LLFNALAEEFLQFSQNKPKVIAGMSLSNTQKNTRIQTLHA